MSSRTTQVVSAFNQHDWDSPLDRTATRILIIDAQAGPQCRLVQDAFGADGVQVEALSAGTGAVDRIKDARPDIIFLDPHLPDGCGLALCREIRSALPGTPVILVTATPSATLAIEATKLGAFDCLLKPLDASQLRRVVADALERGSPSPAIRSESKRREGDTLIGQSAPMREAYQAIGLVSGQDVNVLITGESGTGKELVARAIHQHSARASAPFLALNCAAIPENLLESELFGHEKGAFSGADRRRIGKFEQCTGGTILLDEIGDMPPSLQAKVLRLLQDQTFERVGGNETIRTDVRLIASTHRDLKARAADDRFRADLYYRLSVFTIHVPPLRERGDDLPMLAWHFLQRYGQELGRDAHDFSPDALAILRSYHWPGNVRELQSVMKQALLRSTGETLLGACLPPLHEAGSAARTAAATRFDIDAFLAQRLNADACDLYADLHRELDRHSLARVLTFTGGNQHHASRVLGIARQTLRTKLREAGVRVTQAVEAKPRSPHFAATQPLAGMR